VSARDPGRWRFTGHSDVPLEYFQGVTSDLNRNLYFDGFFMGLYRTDLALREEARQPNAIPPDVATREGYNHLGDLSYDAREGGRLMLPLECFYPGQPNGGNTCRTGSIGVADPRTLRWRYYVKLDPAFIQKAMWNEVSPDGRLLWTSSGDDLLAYRVSQIVAANAAPGGPQLRPVRRIAGAVPPSGITGAAFSRGRLYVAGQGAGPFQVFSIDLATGARRLEIERRWVGESEGIDFFSALGGTLHWLIGPIDPAGRTPTFGSDGSALVHFVRRPPPRIRLAVRPRRVAAGARRRFAFRASVLRNGRRRAVRGALIRFAGRRARTDRRGRATIVRRLNRPGRYRARASRRGLRPGRAVVRVTRPPRFTG
jgi:hypothetical protein